MESNISIIQQLINCHMHTNKYANIIEILPFRVLFIFLRKDAVFQLQGSIYVFVRSTGTSFVETFSEVVAQECVENWIDGGVGITEAGNKDMERYVEPENKSNIRIMLSAN